MSDFELLRDLRAMRQPVPPDADLWPAIAARIAPDAARASRGRRMWPEALAASVLLGVGLAMMIVRSGPAGDPATLADGGMPWSLREAVALDASYAGALREARRDAPQPGPEWARAERELDGAQRAIEDALAQQPDAVHLLGLLRRTHEQRLRLAQRQAGIG
jgi:hypothetical protein